MSDTKLEISSDPERGYRLHAEMTVDLPIETVFDFFSDATKLEQITPPWLNFSVLTPLPITMRKGLLLDYRLYLHRIPINWRTEIAVWEPPFRFVDQQLRGPYQRWYHEHTFEDLGDRTLVVDKVHYIPRGGSLVHRWLVRPDLERIFRYRQETLARIFEEIKSDHTAVSRS